jgi:CheY-like chemotaxis protein
MPIYNVLVVDDSDDDRWLLCRALRDFPSLHIVADLADGDEAVTYLKGEGQFADRSRFPMPDLILLDIKMPRLDGFELLQWINSQRLPVRVVIVSGSDARRDIERAAALGACLYCIKDADSHQVARKVAGFLASGALAAIPEHKPVLLVDDSESDTALIKRQLRRCGVCNPVYVVGSGDEAIQYLSGQGHYSDRERYPLPSVLLLDIKLPGRADGLTVLQWIRDIPTFEKLLVVIISGSEEPGVMGHAYRLGANSFLKKPAGPDEVRNLLNGFSGYWQVEPKDGVKGP